MWWKKLLMGKEHKLAQWNPGRKRSTILEIKGNQFHTILEILATVETVDVSILPNNVLLLERSVGNERRKIIGRSSLLATPTRIIKAVNKEDSEERYVIEVIEETNQEEGNLNEAKCCGKNSWQWRKSRFGYWSWSGCHARSSSQTLMANNKTPDSQYPTHKEEIHGIWWWSKFLSMVLVQ